MQRSKEEFQAEEEKVQGIKAGVSLECWRNRKEPSVLEHSGVREPGSTSERGL